MVINMRVRKDFAGWYIITFANGQRFQLASTGGREYPWNLCEWSDIWHCYDGSDTLCFRTKKEAIEYLKGVEN
jgi:hypothetical protein